MARNVFGNPVTNSNLEGTAEDARILQTLRGFEAMKTYDLDENRIKAREFLEDEWSAGGGVATLCVLYNGTGTTLKLVTSHNYAGYNKETVSFPREIQNGQWGAVLHVQPQGSTTGSSGAVVYRCKVSDGSRNDWVMAWENKHNAKNGNTIRCEIHASRGFDDTFWNDLQKRLADDGKKQYRQRTGAAYFLTEINDEFPAVMTALYTVPPKFTLELNRAGPSV